MIKNINNMSRKEIGTIIIYLGVFVWIPYFLLLFSGREVSMIPYLTLHLLGIFGGAKVRGKIAKETMLFGNRRRKISRILIYIGILAWLPYYYLEGITGLEVDITPFLFVHLSGIMGGVLLQASVWMSKSIRQKTSLETD